jgi:hypothetical protein
MRLRGGIPPTTVDPSFALGFPWVAVSFWRSTRLAGVSTISRVPRRRALRPRAELAPVDVMQKMLGSLPVAAEISRRIGIAATIDEACPVQDRAQSTHGEVIEVLIANRLAKPVIDGGG